MKKITAPLIFACMLQLPVLAQIGIGTTTPAGAAQLEINSNTKGFLPPRMTTTERDNIVSPVPGLQIFNTTTKCLDVYIGGTWQPIACGCSAGPATAPNAAPHVQGQGQIVWNWNMVPGATGYKYNTVNNFGTGTNNGNVISFTQTGLSCSGTNKLLYVWAYNPCGISAPAVLSSNLSYPLQVVETGAGTGTVVSTPAGINCPTDCTEDYNCATGVTLTATPDLHSVFGGWSGPCSGTGTCLVTVNNAQSVFADFDIEQFNMNIAKFGTGSGTVTSSPAGINCGVDCDELFDYNTVVTLTASPAVGSSFVGWNLCGGTGPCNVTMNTARNVNASFALIPYNLTVVKAGTGSGTVTSAPAGISCGSTCVAPFNHNVNVTLSATPAVGSTFAGWSGGGCSGTGNCIILMTAPQTTTATFTLNTYTLSVGTTGSGTVTSSPAGINCGGTCSSSYNYNTVVSLTATASGSGNFLGWSGACSGTGGCNVTMDAAKTVNATFSP